MFKSWGKAEFKDINDFIEWIDPKDVNKLQLEGLVKSGAFDVLEENRNKFIRDFITPSLDSDSASRVASLIKRSI